MSSYEKVLLENSIFWMLAVAVAVVMALYCWFSKKPFIAKTVKVKLSEKTIKLLNFLTSRILPVVMIVAALGVGQNVILDFVLRDFKEGTGVITGFSNNAKAVQYIYVQIGDNSYDLPMNMVYKLHELKGKTCKFVYTPRQRLILGIEEAGNDGDKANSN
jgi:hypothetical protein